MTESQRKECHAHAWNHFTIHAQQRMTSVQFFIALCTVITGGIVLIVKDAGHNKAGAMLALTLPVFAFIFWKLDERTRFLIITAEKALKHLENAYGGLDADGIPSPLKVFLSEERVTRELQQRKFLAFIPSHFTYATCFRCLFASFGVLGLAIAAYLVVI